MTVRRLDHVGIVVSDLDATNDWCRHALGATTGTPFVPETQPSARVCVTTVDAGRLQLIELEHSKGQPFTLANHDVGAFHICLRTADINAAYARLCETGAAFTTAPEVSHAGPAIAYFRDPFGLQYQLIELSGGPLAGGPAPAAIDRKLGTLHHIGLTIPDLDEAVGWFESALGMTTTLTTAASGELPSRMLAVPDAVYRAAMVQAGDQWLELMDFSSPSGQALLPPEGDVGALHLGFAVEDVDAAAPLLRRRGIEITAEPATIASGPDAGARLMSVRGPAGLRIQLTGGA